MQDPYSEIKIEEIRLENTFWKFIRKWSLNGIEFKGDYHNSHVSKTNDFFLWRMWLQTASSSPYWDQASKVTWERVLRNMGFAF